jgi:N-acetylated-alpha-linked acidic dipeptidase
LADADLLPFEFSNLADTAQGYVRELQTLLRQRQDEVRERNREIHDGVLSAVNDPKEPRPIPAVEAVPPALNFAPLENAATALTAAADRYKNAAGKSGASGDVVRAVNARLIQAERQFIDDAGLPRRPWYRHLLYAPGFYTGYGVKTMPGVREGIEQKRYEEAEREAARAAAALNRIAALINGAADSLERGR